MGAHPGSTDPISQLRRCERTLCRKTVQDLDTRLVAKDLDGG